MLKKVGEIIDKNLRTIRPQNKSLYFKMNYSTLARSYSALSSKQDLSKLLTAFFKSDSFSELTKHELAKTINDQILIHYHGEQALKYLLAKEFKDKNYVAAFEVNALNSRNDFLVINGSTKSFEIKSKIDTLQRLSKQALDYGNVFEFNTLVTDRYHIEQAIAHLPEHYGIWYYKEDKRVIFRKSEYSPNLDSVAQISLLNKKEKKQVFGMDTDLEILSTKSQKHINEGLKIALKSRYQSRWNFLTSQWENILPIDIQFFFNKNINPNLVYG